MTRIEASVLSRPIDGFHLRGSTLGEQLDVPGDGPTMLVFLRHFGCIFCREMTRDVHAAAASDPAYPPVVFVGQGDREETDAFLATLWPDASIICDPERTLYSAFGLGKGSIYQMFGPSVWACGVRARLKGNVRGKVIGDPWTMPGVFVANADGEILWTHTFAHAGDHPDWKAIPAAIRAPARHPVSV